MSLEKDKEKIRKRRKNKTNKKKTECANSCQLEMSLRNEEGRIGRCKMSQNE